VIVKGAVGAGGDRDHPRAAPQVTRRTIGSRSPSKAINAAVTLADRYITDRQLPDKAIDVIDEASSRTRLMALTPPAELKGDREGARARHP